MSTLAMMDAGAILNGSSPTNGVSDDAVDVTSRIAQALSRMRGVAYLAEQDSVLIALNDALQDCSTDNWDGYGARAISRASVEHAIVFLAKEL